MKDWIIAVSDGTATAAVRVEAETEAAAVALVTAMYGAGFTYEATEVN